MFRACFQSFVDLIWKKRSDNGQGRHQNMYHEHQVKELCALHALNNLFQDPSAFSKQTLDAICYNLSPNRLVNPHRSIIGLGNYDINVLMAALKLKDCEAIWFDKREDPECLDLENILGFILNVPSDIRFGFLRLPVSRKHWIAVRKLGDSYFNLDSKLDVPLLIGKDGDLLKYLREQTRCKEREIFVIVTEEVEQGRLWRRQV